MKGEESVVADVLSRINTITMPTQLDANTIHDAQATDDELQELIQDTSSSLKLQKINIEKDIEIYCDVKNNVVRPYLPKILRRTVFNVIHNNVTQA